MRQIPFVALALSLGFASFTATGVSPAANPPATTVPIKILDTRVNSFDDASKSYAINRELGRAWIEVTLTVQPSGDDSVAPDVIRVQVPGLGFDAAASAVVFRANDGQTYHMAVKAIRRDNQMNREVLAFARSERMPRASSIGLF